MLAAARFWRPESWSFDSRRSVSWPRVLAIDHGQGRSRCGCCFAPAFCLPYCSALRWPRLKNSFLGLQCPNLRSAAAADIHDAAAPPRSFPAPC